MPQLSLNFDPILLPGQTARLYQDPTNFVDVKVVAAGPLAVHRHDFGTLTGPLLDQDCDHLDMNNGELGHFRYIIRGNFDVHLQNPGGVDQYRTGGTNKATRSSAFRMIPWAQDPDEPEMLQQTYWRMSEFLVIEDRTPRFDLYPYAPTTGAVEGYVDFMGYRLALEALPKGQEGMVHIWVNNWPSGRNLVPA